MRTVLQGLLRWAWDVCQTRTAGSRWLHGLLVPCNMSCSECTKIAHRRPLSICLRRFVVSARLAEVLPWSSLRKPRVEVAMVNAWNVWWSLPVPLSSGNEAPKCKQFPKGPRRTKNTTRSKFTTRSIFNTAGWFTTAAHLVRTPFSWELQRFFLPKKGPRRSKSGGA